MTTCGGGGGALLLRCHGPGVDLLQLAVEPLQLAARRLQLAVHVGRTLAVGDGPSHPLRRLLDLQLLLDLLPQEDAGVLQTLLEHRVQDVAFLQILQVRQRSEVWNTNIQICSSLFQLQQNHRVFSCEQLAITQCSH